jgi:hypothetical protein
MEMKKFVAHANIDHYVGLLEMSDISARNRSMINKLLIEEENKLGRDREHLEFAERRAAACRLRAAGQRRLMDSFAPDSTDWVQAERLLANMESLAQLIEGFCAQTRRQVNGC